MKILIVEDDPGLRRLLAELVRREIVEAEILEADNLDRAVALIDSEGPAAVLSDGTFPTWPARGGDQTWNNPRPNWVGLAGWADKKHIPLVVLTGAGDVAEHARRVGVPVFMKPLETHRAIACLRALVVPKALRENPVVAEVDLENEEVKSRPVPNRGREKSPRPEPGSGKVEEEKDATPL
jgi:CheY-like chemotaxis protein